MLRSGEFEDRLDGFGHVGVAGEFSAELMAAGRRQAVESDAPFGCRDAPFGLDPTLHKHLLKRRVERTFLYLKDFSGDLTDALGDRVAMQGSCLEHAK